MRNIITYITMFIYIISSVLQRGYLWRCCTPSKENTFIENIFLIPWKFPLNQRPVVALSFTFSGGKVVYVLRLYLWIRLISEDESLWPLSIFQRMYAGSPIMSKGEISQIILRIESFLD